MSGDLSRGSKAVRVANKASASAISESIKTASNLVSFRVVLAADLDVPARESIWSIFETNMRSLLIPSSLGWNPPEKRLELFNDLHRFILVHTKEAPHRLVAFVAFRFEFEEGEDTLYCYDLHVSSTARRQGLGRALINQLQNIASDFEMDKIMLTALKSNISALQFYRSVGFELDETSPGDKDEEDYKLLSKYLE